MARRPSHSPTPAPPAAIPAVRPARRLPWIYAIVLFALVWIVFWPALRNDFISFDDGTYVTANPQVQAGLTLHGLAWAFTTTHGSNWHPLTWLSHMLDCQLFGLKPWGHHLTNILLHAANAVLLLLLLNRLTQALLPSFFVAALFALHPAHVESVAWIAERKDVLSSFFFILTLIAYVRGHWTEVRGQKTEVRGQKTEVRGQSVSLSFFAIGLMCKPMLVSLPFVLLLLDFWPLQRWGWPSDRRDRMPAPKPTTLLLEKVPFLVLAGASSVVTFFAQHHAGATEMLAELSWPLRLGNALVSVWRYVGKLLWPTHLSVFYPHPGQWPLLLVSVSAAGIVSLSWLAARYRRRLPFLFVGWFWFLITLLPVLGLVQVGRHSIADRYTYLPSIGLFLVAVWTITALPRWRYELPLALWTACLLVCAGLTWRQLGFWKNSESLFRHAIDVTKENYVAHSNLGDALQRQGRTEEALAEYRLSLAARPDEPNARNAFGSLLLSLGRTEEAIAEFREIIRRAPGFAEAHNNLAYALQRSGKVEEAVAEYKQCLQLRPDDFRVHVNLAGLLLNLGQTETAAKHLEAAVKLNPADLATRKAYATLLFNIGRFEEAVREFQEVIRTGPADAEAHAGLGLALARIGRKQEAIAELGRALELRPDDAETREQLRLLQKN